MINDTWDKEAINQILAFLNSPEGAIAIKQAIDQGTPISKEIADARRFDLGAMRKNTYLPLRHKKKMREEHLLVGVPPAICC